MERGMERSSMERESREREPLQSIRHALAAERSQALSEELQREMIRCALRIAAAC